MMAPRNSLSRLYHLTLARPATQRKITKENHNDGSRREMVHGKAGSKVVHVLTLEVIRTCSGGSSDVLQRRFQRTGKKKM
ncbi:hypothetical protein TIFTF001_029506 [Ficus carica]|uniref:Uncharacterized protein n=1 Tax=Ficus carica TaxID=3494 RepID=A0AA88DSP3_FICCA|nr:hypothetical protein TIFTF001_029506 [Ficus carica]